MLKKDTDITFKIDFDIIEKSLEQKLEFHAPAYIVSSLDEISKSQNVDIALCDFNSYQTNALHLIAKSIQESLNVNINFIDTDNCQYDTFYHSISNFNKSNIIIKEMKNPDKLYLTTPEMKQPLEYTIQVHFDGVNAHTDFRYKISKKTLGGWSFNNLKPGAIQEPVNNLKIAKKYLKDFSLEGNQYFEPLLQPKNIISKALKEHDKNWFNIDELEIKIDNGGESEKGNKYIITIEKGLVDIGMQLPYFHEYFLIGDKFSGQLRLKSIESDGREIEGQVPIKKGDIFWISNFSKTIKPYLLTKRSITKKAMPLPDSSGIPYSIHKDIPKEYKYWKESDKKRSFDMRKQLIESKLIQDDSIRNVDKKYRLVHKKLFLGADLSLLAKDCFTSFEFKQQNWLNNDGDIRRNAWYLSFKNIDLPSVCISNYTNIDSLDKISIIETENDLFGIEGDIDPNSKYNTSKSMLSNINNIDSGNVEIICKNKNSFDIDFSGTKLIGKYHFSREEPNSKYWLMSKNIPEKEKSAYEVVKSDNNIECINCIGYELEEKDLRPFTLFSPADISQSSKSLTEIAEQYSKNPYKSIGYTVQRIEKGLRCVVQGKDNKFLAYHVNSEDLYFLKINENIKKELLVLNDKIGDFVLDCNLVFNDDKIEHEDILKGLDTFLDNNDYHFSVLHIIYSSTLNIKKSLDKFSVNDLLNNTTYFSMPTINSFSDINIFKKVIKGLKDNRYNNDFLLKPKNNAYSENNIDSWQVFKEYRTINCIVLDKKKPDGRQKTNTYSFGLAVSSGVNYPKDKLVTLGKSLYVKAFVGIKSEDTFDISNKVSISFKSAKCLIRKGIFIDSSIKQNGLELSSVKSISFFDDFVSKLNPNEVEIEKLDLDYISICKGIEERYILGIVLEPDIVDGQNEVVSKQEIRQACFSFMENYKKLGVYHTEENKGRLAILENFLAPVTFTLGEREVVEGTWLMGIRVMDDSLWSKIKNGDITGLSIFGRSRRVANKKTTIKIRKV